MNSDLKQLIRLQSIDLAIQEIRARVDKFPGISKALDEKLRAATMGLESAKEKVKLNPANRKKLEIEVGSFEAKISKYREQMLSVKSNEEYKSFQKEIEFTQTNIRKIEDQIIVLMEEFESHQSAVKVAEVRLKDDQKLVTEERQALEKIHKEDVSALDAYLAERKEIEKTINPDLLPRYERVRKHRGGIAVAAARDYACEGCKVRMRPQFFQEIIRNDQLIECEACQRILYYPENMDHPFEVA